jgi:hypothetical protein
MWCIAFSIGGEEVKMGRRFYISALSHSQLPKGANNIVIFTSYPRPAAVKENGGRAWKD